ncbi:DUF2937 family protein [Actibacterium sp. MT2.3-13A]|uniref:DUF2937 family protein n=1 Tax=Actibacterium sp. MT2.3-13A TaxID=2828332 RepID=UPI001BA7E68F|nr:DUF2937 family protein [Actibacterium sp. MT2.3-13A]
MIRSLALAGGIAGAVALSQFPEFSQQYLQRLSGAVNELRPIALAFDVSAQAAGLSRDEALARLEGSDFEETLRDTMAGRLARYDRLSRDYASLRDKDPLGRLAQVWRFSDPDLARRTWEEFRPAVPATADGLICAGIGYGAGWLSVMGLFAGLRRLFGRRRRAV